MESATLENDIALHKTWQAHDFKQKVRIMLLILSFQTLKQKTWQIILAIFYPYCNLENMNLMNHKHLGYFSQKNEWTNEHMCGATLLYLAT